MKREDKIEELANKYKCGQIIAEVLLRLEERGISYTFKGTGEKYWKVFAGWEYTYSLEVGENRINVSNIFTRYEDSYTFEPDTGDNICIEHDDTESEIANCVEQIIALLI